MTDIESQITSGASTPSTDGAGGPVAHEAAEPSGRHPTHVADTVDAINSSAYAGTLHLHDVSAVTHPIDPATFIRRSYAEPCENCGPWIPCDACIEGFNDGFK